MATTTKANLDSHPIDYDRPMKVIVIGAGISGVLAAIRMPRRIPNLQLVVYDKNSDVGGTWFENKYPGIACDIPAHVYQASFEPNTNWSHFYASGSEILAYWKGIAEKYGVYKHVQFGYKVVEARFEEDTNQWRVTVQNVNDGTTKTDVCDVLYMCVGALNDWHWPDIAGLHSFSGKLMHSAAWDEAWDPVDKKVAVIGCGSSAIQIVPALQKQVAHLDNYVRGQTWIAPPIAEAEVRRHTKTGSNFVFTEEEKKTFRQDPEKLLAYRKKLDSEIQSMTQVTIRGGGKDGISISEKARNEFKANMEAKLLPKRPGILAKIVPSFAPGCRRITPGPGYLEALTEDNVGFVSDGIDHITKQGIVTTDGTLRQYDAIVCATGFDTSFTRRAALVYGRNKTDLRDHWKDYPQTYVGVATDQFPNLFFAHGPMAGLGVGSVAIVLERTCDYVCAVVRKMQRDRVATMAAKPAACAAFHQYCDAYFDKTVFSLPCRSWYKKDGAAYGPVTALWPGSALHFVKMLEKPRFEDYDYTYLDGNTTAWLGNGFTKAESDPTLDKSAYLNPENVDYPSVDCL